MREGLQNIASDEETIVAIATPAGHSGIGIVRVSGSKCLTIAAQCFSPRNRNRGPQHRAAVVGEWLNSVGEKIDDVVVTYFHAPYSYTGEDVLEISAHGNPTVLHRILVSAQSWGARQAAAGEFTLRAVAHGKLDLVQAEAVRDFVHAQTEHQARIALRQMEGALSKRLRPIKSALIDVIAGLEAGIDFAEDDVDIPSNAVIAAQIEPLRAELHVLADSFAYGKMLTAGIRLAILGKPNVGKSSLFNRLLSSDRAIVTDIPGTTRDVITETLAVGGVPVALCDTAGIRTTTDAVESIGVSRTFETLAEAHLALVVVDGAGVIDEDDERAMETAARVPHILVINKSDLPQTLPESRLNGAARVRISARTGHGVEDLRQAIWATIFSRNNSLEDDAILTNARHHEAVSTAESALLKAQEALSRSVPHEMVLLDLYRGLGALRELTGDVVADDILDRIFATFCIGK